MGNSQSHKGGRIPSGRKQKQKAAKEDDFAMLRNYDTVIIVDDSSSMQGELWQEAGNALADVARLVTSYDADGVDVCFLNNMQYRSRIKDPETVRELFKSVHPSRATPIGARINELVHMYLDILDSAKDQADAGNPAELQATKPRNFLFLTDGKPSDDPVLPIIKAAQRLDARNFPIAQVGIQFVQIGNNRSTTAYLNQLDDDLTKKYKIRDIVDTAPAAKNGRPLKGETLVKILLGAINKRVDNRKK